MLIPNKHASSNSYRYGFNGKENDNEVMGEGNFEDYGMRMYNTRLGRFFNVDPLTKAYPMLTPYQFASNTPIQAIDLDGLERLDVTSYDPKTKEVKLKIIKNIYLDKPNMTKFFRNVDSNKVHNIFSQGNCELYACSLPENGKELQFTTVEDYNAGVAYKISVEYDVNTFYVDDINSYKITLPENSHVVNGVNEIFSEEFSAAKGLTDLVSRVYTNPNYPPEDANTDLTAEEIIAHEVGYHNMGGKKHTSSGGKAFYPAYKTLESNVHGNVTPNEQNVIDNINNGLKNRKSLNDPNNELSKN